jgi:phenylacetate-CoA ligase
VPSGPIQLEELDRLPVVTKPALMARFDHWVTDPAVTRVGVEQFVANLDNLGRDFSADTWCSPPPDRLASPRS